MFEFITGGLGLLWDSVKALLRYPKFLIPLLMVWLIYAPITLYLYFNFTGAGYSVGALLLILAGLIYLFALLFSFSCVLLLELIQQHETGKPFSLAAALSETITKDLVSILIISFIWAAIWFVLTIIDIIVKAAQGKRRGSRPPPSPQAAAAALSGTGGVFSWISLGIHMIEKLVRMTVFLILPAVAWEDKNAFSAIGRGLSVLKDHVGEFLTAYATTGILSTLIFLPAILVVLFVQNAPDIVWYLVIAYTAIAWTFSIYIEQMTVALLFLWHKKWEVAADEALKAGKPVPKLEDVPMPSLLNDVNDLETKGTER